MKYTKSLYLYIYIYISITKNQLHYKKFQYQRQVVKQNYFVWPQIPFCRGQTLYMYKVKVKNKKDDKIWIPYVSSSRNVSQNYQRSQRSLAARWCPGDGGGL